MTEKGTALVTKKDAIKMDHRTQTNKRILLEIKYHKYTSISPVIVFTPTFIPLPKGFTTLIPVFFIPMHAIMLYVCINRQ